MEESSYRLASSLHGESTFPLGDISLSPALLCICTFVEGQCIVSFVYIGFVGVGTAVLCALLCGRGAFLPSPVHRQEKKGRISFAARTKKGQFSGFPPPLSSVDTFLGREDRGQDYRYFGKMELLRTRTKHCCTQKTPFTQLGHLHA